MLATFSEPSIRSNTALHLVHEVTELVLRRASVDQLLDFVFDHFRGLIPYDRIGYSYVDAARDRVIARWTKSTYPVKLRPGFAARLAGSSLQSLLQTREPRILGDLWLHLQRHPRSESTHLLVEEGMRSSLTCPLLVRDKAVGFLFFTSVEPDRYSQNDVELIEEIADHLAWLIEQGQLHDELRSVQGQLATERELRIAAERQAKQARDDQDIALQVQKTLFPAALPQLEGYRFAARLQPAADVGGSFLDVFPLPDNRLGLLIADCGGHGHQGVMLKTILHAIVRLTTWNSTSAPQILADLNDALAKCFPSGTIVSAVVAVFDHSRGTVQWANAKHPAPILVRPAGYTLDAEQHAGKSVLGAERQIIFDTECMPLGPGDKLLFCSPGLMQAHFRNEPTFGEERLHRLLTEHACDQANELVNHLWDDLYQFVKGEPQPDDLLALVLERHPQHIACRANDRPEFCWRNTLIADSTTAVAGR